MFQNMRFERKFVSTELSRESVISVIKTSSGVFSEIYNQRFINNIYLDTNQFSYYSDHVNGCSQRMKVRIRWYGDQWGLNSKPRLEFKMKNGGVGDKLVFDLTPFVVDNNFNWKFMLGVCQDSDLPAWVIDELLMLRPVLFNRYSRQYFLSSDRKFRITVDDKLYFYKIQQINNNFIEYMRSDLQCIVELKYKTDERLRPDYITCNFPFRLAKNSKYVYGVGLLYRNMVM